MLHYFNSYEPKADSFGVLPVNLKKLSPDVAFEAVATPPMRAIRNLTEAFKGSVPVAQAEPVNVQVTALGSQGKIFDGDATHPPLWEREVLAVLPFQVRPGKHVIARLRYDP